MSNANNLFYAQTPATVISTSGSTGASYAPTYLLVDCSSTQFYTTFVSGIIADVTGGAGQMRIGRTSVTYTYNNCSAFPVLYRKVTLTCKRDLSTGAYSSLQACITHWLRSGTSSAGGTWGGIGQIYAAQYQNVAWMDPFLGYDFSRVFKVSGSRRLRTWVPGTLKKFSSTKNWGYGVTTGHLEGDIGEYYARKGDKFTYVQFQGYPCINYADSTNYYNDITPYVLCGFVDWRMTYTVTGDYIPTRSYFSSTPSARNSANLNNYPAKIMPISIDGVQLDPTPAISVGIPTNYYSGYGSTPSYPLHTVTP